MWVLSGILISSIWSTSCRKESGSRSILPETNSATMTDIGSKNYRNQVFIMDIGHDGKKCPGCMYMNGRLFHQDCQGSGNVCRVSSRLTLYPGGSSMNAVTTDTFGLTDQSFFNMPARSLYTEDEKGQPVYLNIPAQLVYRDSTTLQFTFTGLYYTNSPDYTND